jgi:signal transduction histidine kinase
MRERADNIGAVLRIESQLGHGTQVVFKWPAISS